VRGAEPRWATRWRHPLGEIVDRMAGLGRDRADGVRCHAVRARASATAQARAALRPLRQ
jgi:hypothetical protein